MFIQRYAIDQNKDIFLAVAQSITRKLSVSVQKLVARKVVDATAAPSVAHCEDGVCSITWKPQRPAA